MDMPSAMTFAAEKTDIQAQVLEMYQRHGRIIISQIRGRVPQQDVEDVLCAVVDAMMQRLPQLQGYSHIRQAMYLRAIARNEVADYLRSRVRTRERIADMEDEDMAALADDSDSVEAIVIRQDALERMRAAIQRLPQHKRDLLEMKYMQELSDEQIARKFGISPAGVRKRLSRLRTELRAMMKEDGYE